MLTSVIVLEQRDCAPVSFGHGLRSADVRRGGDARLLPRPGDEPRPRPPWDVCHVRRVREPRVGVQADGGAEGREGRTLAWLSPWILSSFVRLTGGSVVPSRPRFAIIAQVLDVYVTVSYQDPTTTPESQPLLVNGLQYL